MCWISLNRDIQSHWIWKKETFSKGQAWIDLLLSASFKDNKFLLGNQLIVIKRGSFVTSILKLSERWEWSRHKVSSFLNQLESDAMLTHKRDTKKTIITICNYDRYQTNKKAKGQQKDIKRTSKGHQKDTINKENKENKENINKDIIDFVGAFLNNRLHEKPNYFPNGITESQVNNGYDTVEKLIRIDKQSIETIKDVLRLAIKDEFWSRQVITLSGLRNMGKNGLTKFANMREGVNNFNGEEKFNKADYIRQNGIL